MQSLGALVSYSVLSEVPFQLHVVSITTMMLILFIYPKYRGSIFNPRLLTFDI